MTAHTPDNTPAPENDTKKTAPSNTKATAKKKKPGSFLSRLFTRRAKRPDPFDTPETRETTARAAAAQTSAKQARKQARAAAKTARRTKRAAEREQIKVRKSFLKDGTLRRMFNKRQNMRILRRMGMMGLLSASLSTATILKPDIVSKPYNDHMRDLGRPGDMKEHFHTGSIRVYHRHNPLQAFHIAGTLVKNQWSKQYLKHQTPKQIAYNAVLTPFNYTSTVLRQLHGMIRNHPLDAFSFTPVTSYPVEGRQNFIRPPAADLTARTIIEGFTGIDPQHMTFKNDEKRLAALMYDFVMLHEARHADQSYVPLVYTNESDADLYAIRVLLARGVDRELLSEAYEVITHARTLSAVVRGGFSHATSPALMTGQQSPLQTHYRTNGFMLLHYMLSEADRVNRGIFPPDTPAAVRFAYMTAAMKHVQLSNISPHLRDACDMMLAAANYFDQKAGGKLIDKNFNIARVNLAYMVFPYTPVQDKLHRPAAKPAAPDSVTTKDQEQKPESRKDTVAAVIKKTAPKPKTPL